LGISPPYRALGAITLAAVAQGAVAYAIGAELGGAVSMLVSLPAAIVVYLVVLRLLSAARLIDPDLMSRLVGKVPQRFRQLTRRLLNVPD
jgi:hypothetical protein